MTTETCAKCGHDKHYGDGGACVEPFCSCEKFVPETRLKFHCTCLPGKCKCKNRPQNHSPQNCTERENIHHRSVGSSVNKLCSTDSEDKPSGTHEASEGTQAQGCGKQFEDESNIYYECGLKLCPECQNQELCPLCDVGVSSCLCEETKNPPEFVLSEKMLMYGNTKEFKGTICYSKEDVKTFIQKLKEEVDRVSDIINYDIPIKDEIDKLCGKDLI